MPFRENYIFSSERIPKNWIVLYRDNRIVWFGKIDEPYEDVDFTSAHINPEDFDRMLEIIKQWT